MILCNVFALENGSKCSLLTGILIFLFLRRGTATETSCKLSFLVKHYICFELSSDNGSQKVKFICVLRK